MEQRKTLSLKCKNSPATETPKSLQAKTPQEAPQQAKKKNKADKKQHPYSEALDAIQ